MKKIIIDTYIYIFEIVKIILRMEGQNEDIKEME